MAGTNAFIDEFFARYPSFHHDPSRPVMEEFYEMADFYDWDRDEKEYPRDMLREALVEQFNSTYGVDEHSLAEWTNLCQLMGIHPIPTDLEGCRQKVRSSYVNIVDLVDLPITGVKPTLFSTEKALSAYTITTGKFFPRNHVRAGGLLRYLLRQILTPGSHPRGGGAVRGGRGRGSRGRGRG